MKIKSRFYILSIGFCFTVFFSGCSIFSCQERKIQHSSYSSEKEDKVQHSSYSSGEFNKSDESEFKKK